MSQTNEAKNVNIGVNGTLILSGAQVLNILERRRITIAIHQTPDPAKTLTGTINIWGSIIPNDDAWYIPLGNIVLNTAVERTQMYNVINNITSGTALRSIKITYSAVVNGIIDIKLFEMEN